MKNLLLLFLIIITCSASKTFSQQKAFPTAYGGGAYASGGRDGNVYHVTNLLDDGSQGTLRWAIAQPRPATIVFDVSGTINLTSWLQIYGNDLTIAGQTAPLGGITITTTNQARFRFRECSNIIMRYIRIRPTESPNDSFEVFSNSTAFDIILDHISVSYGGDESISIRGPGTHNITFQRLLIADGKTGTLFGDSATPANSYDNSFLNSLFWNISHRHPNPGSNGRVDIINNVVQNWQYRLSTVNGDIQLNHVNNYYALGSRESLQGGGSQIQVNTLRPSSNNRIYTAGNIADKGQFTDPNADNRVLWVQLDNGVQDTYAPASEFVNSQYPLIGAPFEIKSAEDAYADVIANVGANASLNADGSVTIYTDANDTAYLNIMAAGEGSYEHYEMYDNVRSWFDGQRYFDFVASISTVPINERANDFYSSNPHIPETWFQNNVPEGADHNSIPVGSHYTYLELYLNGVDEEFVAIGAESVSVTPDTVELQIPNTIALTATVLPDNATNKTGIWSSSDESIATVDSNGVVTPVAVGEATITFTTDDGGFTDTSQITVFPEALQASAGSDQQICEGDSTTLTASGGTIYIWNTGETTASIDVFPNETTTYSVTVSDEYGQSDEDDITIFVNPIPIAEAGEDQTICEGETTTLTASGGDSYLWSTGDTTSTIDVNPTQDTTYEVEVISNNCASIDNVTVFVTEAPDITVTEDFVLVEGETATLVANGSDNYLWSTGETSVSIDISPLETTTYTVSSLAGNGCSTTLNVIVTVIPEVVADAGLDTSICRDDIITLTATGGGTYLWDTGDTSAEVQVVPQITTTYTVTVTDDYGYSDSDSVTITVNETPDITVSDDIAILEGVTVTLTATGGDNYLWNTGDTTDSIVVTPSETTTYTVISTAIGGCADIEQVTVTIIPEVIADAGEDATICIGNSITLNASGGGTYLWNTGATSAELLVTPQVTTTYTVTVTDDYGYSDSDSVTITVNEVPDITVSDDIIILVGETITLTATGGDNYLWNTGDTTASIVVTPSETTTYTVISTAIGDCTDIEQVTVSVIPEVIADAGEDVAICIGESVVLNATGGGTYLWDTGSTNSSLAVSPNLTTTYTVTVTDDYGYTDTDSVTVIVNETPNLTVSNNITILEGETITLYAEGATTYEWSTSETTSSITVSPTQSTTYTVVGTTNTCSAETDVTVTVEPLFTASAGDDQRVCDNGNYEVTLTANLGDSYLWNTGETTQSIIVSPLSTTTYTVTVIYEDQVDTDDVTVYVDPNPEVEIANGDSVDIMSGDFVTLSASGADTYEWSNGATQPNIAVSPSSTTTYEVKGYIGNCDDEKQVTVNVIPEVVADAGEDIVICLDETAVLTATGGDDYVWSTGETTQSIQVSPDETTDYTVTVFNALDFDEATVTVSVDLNCEDEETPIANGPNFSFDIFPNPANNILNVRLSNGALIVSYVHIYDVTGKLIHSTKIVNENLDPSTVRQIDISALNKGVYFVKLIDINRELTRRLIVN